MAKTYKLKDALIWVQGGEGNVAAAKGLADPAMDIDALLEALEARESSDLFDIESVDDEDEIFRIRKIENGKRTDEVLELRANEFDRAIGDIEAAYLED